MTTIPDPLHFQPASHRQHGKWSILLVHKRNSSPRNKNQQEITGATHHGRRHLRRASRFWTCEAYRQRRRPATVLVGLRRPPVDKMSAGPGRSLPQPAESAGISVSQHNFAWLRSPKPKRKLALDLFQAGGTRNAVSLVAEEAESYHQFSTSCARGSDDLRKACVRIKNEA